MPKLADLYKKISGLEQRKAKGRKVSESDLKSLAQAVDKFAESDNALPGRFQPAYTGNATAPAADTAPAAPNPEENFMRANSSNNREGGEASHLF